MKMAKHKDRIKCYLSLMPSQLYAEQIIFFPGDVQQLGRNGLLNLNVCDDLLPLCDLSVVCRYLEDAASNAFTWVILPSQSANFLNSFAPLLEFQQSGSPIFKQSCNAIGCPFEWLRKVSTEENRNVRNSVVEGNLKTTLIGFSKGCTVINQCLMSMCEKCASTEDGCFNIKKIVLLDSGHNGSHTFFPVTVIPQLKKMEVKVDIWVSPFQMREERNGDVKQREIDQLCEALPGMVSVRKCRWKDAPSLDSHFFVLKEFLESLKST